MILKKWLEVEESASNWLETVIFVFCIKKFDNWRLFR